MSNPYYTRTGEPVQNSSARSQPPRNEYALVENGFDALHEKIVEIESTVASSGGGLVPRATRPITANYTTALDDDRRILQITAGAGAPITIYLKDAQDVIGLPGYEVTISNMSAVSHTISRQNLTNTINEIAGNVVILPGDSFSLATNSLNNGYVISASADHVLRDDLNDANGGVEVGFRRAGYTVTRNLDIQLQESFVSIGEEGAVTGIDQTTQIQAVIDKAKVYGRTIRVPSRGGAYLYTSLNLDDIDNGVKFLGEGNPYRGGLSGALNTSELRCIASGSGTGISVGSSFGITFEDLYLSYSNAGFTGKLIRAAHSTRGLDTAHFTIHRCKLAGLSSAVNNASSLLSIAKCILSNFKSNLWQHAVAGIVVDGSHYANAINITDMNVFVELETDAIIFEALSGSQGINITGNGFEPRVNGTASRILVLGNTQGMTIATNWFGDATPGQSWVRSVGSFGTSITGNFFFTEPPNYAIELEGCFGTHIAGNRFFNLALNSFNSPGTGFCNNDCQIGDTAVFWVGTQPDIFNNGGMTDRLRDLRVSGGASPKLVLAPSTGATSSFSLAQQGDNVFFSDDGVAGRLQLGVKTGAFYLATPAAANQTACAIFGGSGAPNNADGNDGSVYFRADGGVGTTVYLKVAGVWTGRA